MDNIEYIAAQIPATACMYGKAMLIARPTPLHIATFSTVNNITLCLVMLAKI